MIISARDLDVWPTFLTQATRELLARADALRKWKERGDRVVVALAAAHLACIAAVVWIVTSENFLRGYEDPRRVVLERILASEAVNFLIWFPKFAPIFLALYPIHRAMWYQGGAYADYARGRRRLRAYRRSAAFRDPHFPRCVKPETKRVRAARSCRRSVSGRLALSTIRRDDSARSDLSDNELGDLPDRRGDDLILPGPVLEL